MADGNCLQDVDGLKPSEHLIKTVVQHIEGYITIDQVKDMLDTYYETKDVREHFFSLPNNELPPNLSFSVAIVSMALL